MPPKREPPKREREVSRIDGVAWILLVAGLLVALCVCSYEPESRGAPAQNLLGKPGAWLAGELFDSLGLGVHVLLASWFVLVVSLLLRKSWRLWGRRLLGWLALVPSAAVGPDRIGPTLLPTTVAGPGGTVGAILGHRLQIELGPIGAMIAFSVVAAIATLLALDFILVRLLRSAWTTCQWCGFVVGSALHWSITPKPQPKKQPAAPAAPKSTGVPISHSGVPNITITVPKNAEPEPATPNLRIHHVASPEPDADDATRFENFELPPITLLADSEPFRVEEHEVRLRQTATLLEKTFLDFDLRVKVVGINTGPVITQYEIQLETGMRVSKVTVLADDLALHMKVPSVRIVAPIPGKNAVGIEVPNESRVTVRLKELYLGAARKLAKSKLPLLLGKDTEGRPLVQDLAELPHLLIAGTTGTGKSVCLNSIITSILMTRRPDECKLILIDPKMTELTEYGKIPHMMHPVVTDMKKAEAILAWAVDKMEERYELLSRCRVRNIATYNELGEEEIKTRLGVETEEEAKAIQAKLPYIVIVVDELADLMMMMKREVESHIIRLAQKSRAAGIHLVLATQKPTVDVITGLIKSNLPGRICFKVSSRTDSRVVLDEMGADKLLGKGDMLFLQPGTSILVRAQGTYIADAEITKIVEHLGTDAPCYDPSLVNLKPAGEEGAAPNAERFKPRDELYQQAVTIVIREGRGSCSLLQRALGIGYGRAARLIDFMAEDGIVGAYNGSNAREVIISPEEWDRMAGGTAAAAEAEHFSNPRPRWERREYRQRVVRRYCCVTTRNASRIRAELAASSGQAPWAQSLQQPPPLRRARRFQPRQFPERVQRRPVIRRDLPLARRLQLRGEVLGLDVGHRPRSHDEVEPLMRRPRSGIRDRQQRGEVLSKVRRVGPDQNVVVVDHAAVRVRPRAERLPRQRHWDVERRFPSIRQFLPHDVSHGLHRLLQLFLVHRLDLRLRVQRRMAEQTVAMMIDPDEFPRLESAPRRLRQPRIARFENLDQLRRQVSPLEPHQRFGRPTGDRRQRVSEARDQFLGDLLLAANLEMRRRRLPRLRIGRIEREPDQCGRRIRLRDPADRVCQILLILARPKDLHPGRHRRQRLGCADRVAIGPDL